MKLKECLKTNTHKLEHAGIQTARLDTIIVLETVIKKNRSWILANPDAKVSKQQLDYINNLINRRSLHEPIAYILERVEFYGRNFIVGPGVLIPRPESEAIIETLINLVAINYSATKSISIADVGTGSGALGITAALEVPSSDIDLLDIDNEALAIAKLNVDIFTLNIQTIHSDLLQEGTHDYDILLCNLPYVPDDHGLNKAALYEPPQAIFGGIDGLSYYRRLFRQLAVHRHKPLYILCESLPLQHLQLSSLASQSSYKLINDQDFVQLFQYHD